MVSRAYLYYRRQNHLNILRQPRKEKLLNKCAVCRCSFCNFSHALQQLARCTVVQMLVVDQGLKPFLRGQRRSEQNLAFHALISGSRGWISNNAFYSRRHPLDASADSALINQLFFSGLPQNAKAILAPMRLFNATATTTMIFIEVRISDLPLDRLTETTVSLSLNVTHAQVSPTQQNSRLYSKPKVISQVVHALNTSVAISKV
ncbi:unnamed protein product [Acanthosepion pharaonis]|uniref:Uncharacterized protein n=1 Tax=Acanthosepion pharaonis TaxID=158019 RepID=A0A812ES95_ACAPH|nr:unnamed protein product [Sepia pharaonis]